MTRKKTEKEKAAKKKAGRKKPERLVRSAIAFEPPSWWSKFILSLVRCGNTRRAADDAGVKLDTARDEMNRHPELKAEADEARAVRRAVYRGLVYDYMTKGIRTPVEDAKGKITGYQYHQPSDQFRLAVLRAELNEFRTAFLTKQNQKAEPEEPVGGSLSVGDLAVIFGAIAQTELPPDHRSEHFSSNARTPAIGVGEGESGNVDNK